MNFVDERLLPRYLNRAGESIGPIAWAALRCDTRYCHIEFDEHVSDPAGIICAVVTSWAGVNLAPFAPDTGVPYIFETTIFGGRHNLAATVYTTEAQARAGHAATLADLRAGKTPWWMAQEEEVC
jgi:hypothetical protein